MNETDSAILKHIHRKSSTKPGGLLIYRGPWGGA